MKIWLLQVGEPLPTDQPPPRMLRTGQLATYCADQNDRVVWWTSAFSHQTKELRSRGSYRIATEHSNYQIEIVKALGYRGHASLRRLMDEILVAFRILKHSRKYDSPDIIVVSLPTLSAVFAARAMARKHSAKLVVDIRDLWPDILVNKLEGGIKVRLGRLLVWVLRKYLRRVLKGADSLIGTSPMFVNWGQNLAGRNPTNHDAHFPISVERQSLNHPSFRIQALVEPLQDKPIAIFAGTLVPQFDFSTVEVAARRNPQLNILVCGDGPLREKLLEDSPGNMHITGWLGQEDLQWVLSRASVGLAPYKSTKDFELNFPNKFVEYLASGLPIISSIQKGPAYEMIASNQIGSSIPLTDQDAWAAALKFWCEISDDETTSLQARCQFLYKQNFDSGVINSAMRNHLRMVNDA